MSGKVNVRQGKIAYCLFTIDKLKEEKSMRKPTIDDIIGAVKSSFTQDCVHSSAIHWSILNSPSGTRIFVVNYEGKKGYYITGDVCQEVNEYDPKDVRLYYRMGDAQSGEALRFYEDHIESFPNHREDGIKFDSEPLDTLYSDFVDDISDPEYDIYGQIWDKNDDGTYSLTKEVAEECARRDEQIRNSRPESMPTNAEIGMGLLDHLLSVGALKQQVLSAKHLLNADNITDIQSVLNLTEGECQKPDPERQKRINKILRYHGKVPERRRYTGKAYVIITGLYEDQGPVAVFTEDQKSLAEDFVRNMNRIYYHHDPTRYDDDDLHNEWCRMIEFDANSQQAIDIAKGGKLWRVLVFKSFSEHKDWFYNFKESTSRFKIEIPSHQQLDPFGHDPRCKEIEFDDGDDFADYPKVIEVHTVIAQSSITPDRWIGNIYVEVVAPDEETALKRAQFTADEWISKKEGTSR